MLAGVVAGVSLTVAFVARDLRARTPLFDVRILGRPVVAAGSITLFVAYVSEWPQRRMGGLGAGRAPSDAMTLSR